MDGKTDRGEKLNNRLNILVIDDDADLLTLVVVRSLSVRKNLVIHVLNLNNMSFPSFRFSRCVSTYTSIDARSDEQVFDSIKETCLKVKADIIIPVKEKTVRIISERIRRFLEFTLVPFIPSPEILELVRNKWLLYNWLYEKQLMADKPLKLIDALQSERIISNLNYPVLIKPFWGSGGQGIKLIRNRQELINYKPEKNFGMDQLLVQQYFSGSDIDLSALVDNGKIVAYTIQRDFSGTEKFVYSKKIEFIHNQLLLNTASFIFSELNYSGIAHLDFRNHQNKETFTLVDFNARFWSSMLGSMHAGINFPWLWCLTAMHEKIPVQEYTDGKYIVSNNLFSMLLSGYTPRYSELQYTLKDPLPLLIITGRQTLYHLKRFFKSALTKKTRATEG